MPDSSSSTDAASVLEQKALGLLEAMPALAGANEVKLAEIALIVAGAGFAVGMVAFFRIAAVAQRKLEATIAQAKNQATDPRPAGS